MNTVRAPQKYAKKRGHLNKNIFEQEVVVGALAYEGAIEPYYHCRAIYYHQEYTKISFLMRKHGAFRICTIGCFHIF